MSAESGEHEEHVSAHSHYQMWGFRRPPHFVGRQEIRFKAPLRPGSKFEGAVNWFIRNRIVIYVFLTLLEGGKLTISFYLFFPLMVSNRPLSALL
jgi:hypothetical protein